MQKITIRELVASLEHGGFQLPPALEAQARIDSRDAAELSQRIAEVLAEFAGQHPEGSVSAVAMALLHRAAIYMMVTYGQNACDFGEWAKQIATAATSEVEAYRALLFVEDKG